MYTCAAQSISNNCQQSVITSGSAAIQQCQICSSKNKN